MNLGVILSLATGLCWAFSPLVFTSVARRIGSLRVAILRSVAASLLFASVLAVYLALVPAARHAPSASAILWLALSALCGMVLADVMTYEALVLVGPRRDTQIGMLAPVFAILGSWTVLHEHLSCRILIGIAMVIAATTAAVFNGPTGRQSEPGRISLRGLALAVGGAAFTGLAAVAVRMARLIDPSMNSLVASTIRVSFSGLFLGIVLVVRGDVSASLKALNDRHLLRRFVPGVLIGPGLGVFCYVAALGYAPTGIVSTLAATSPLFILPMVWYRYKSRIGWRVFWATVAGIVGIALMRLADT